MDGSTPALSLCYPLRSILVIGAVINSAIVYNITSYVSCIIMAMPVLTSRPNPVGPPSRGVTASYLSHAADTQLSAG